MSRVNVEEKWPVLGRHERAAEWLGIWTDLGRAPRTIDAYARGLAEYLLVCERDGVDPLTANRSQVAVFVRELATRPQPRRQRGRAGLRGRAVERHVAAAAGAGAAVLRLPDRGGRAGVQPGRPRPLHPWSAVRRRLPGRWCRGWSSCRGSRPRASGLRLLEVFRRRADPQPVDAGVGLRLGAAPGGAVLAAHRRSRSRRTGRCGSGRRRPRPAGSGWCRTRPRPGCCWRSYLRHRGTLSRARGPLFLSESRRNLAEPLTLWTWSKVVRRVALAADVPRFSTHTTRHLCLTDLARMGWELHAIATFAGHRSTESTLRYIHLSGRDLAGQAEPLDDADPRLAHRACSPRTQGPQRDPPADRVRAVRDDACPAVPCPRTGARRSAAASSTGSPRCARARPRRCRH